MSITSQRAHKMMEKDSVVKNRLRNFPSFPTSVFLSVSVSHLTVVLYLLLNKVSVSFFYWLCNGKVFKQDSGEKMRDVKAKPLSTISILLFHSFFSTNKAMHGLNHEKRLKLSN